MNKLLCVFYRQHIENKSEIKLWEVYGNFNHDPIFFFTKSKTTSDPVGDGSGYTLIHKSRIIAPSCSNYL